MVKILRNAFLVLAVVLFAGSLFPTGVLAGDKITICHVAGLAGSDKTVTITADRHAIYNNGEGGHFYENGTARAGHEDDYLGACAVDPTEEPTETVVPTDPPTDEPTETVTPTDVTEVPTDVTKIPTDATLTSLLPTTGANNSGNSKTLLMLGFASLGAGFILAGVDKKIKNI